MPAALITPNPWKRLRQFRALESNPVESRRLTNQHVATVRRNYRGRFVVMVHDARGLIFEGKPFGFSGREFSCVVAAFWSLAKAKAYLAELV